MTTSLNTGSTSKNTRSRTPSLEPDPPTRRRSYSETDAHREMPLVAKTTLTAADAYLRSFWTPAADPHAAKKLIIVMRAPERMDRVHGEDWESTQILNGYPADDMSLLSLLDHNYNFTDDPPITEIGHGIARIIMRGILLRGLRIKKIICSPALRCVQTASEMAKYMNDLDKVKVCIEPGLFEPTEWYRDENNMLTLGSIGKTDFTKFGYPIDKNYRPIIDSSYYDKEETEMEARQRIDQTLRIIGLSNLQGPLLIVGHAITIYTAIDLPLRQPADALDESWLEVTSTGEGPLECPATDEKGLDHAELGIRYPPGCVITIARESEGPPSTYQLLKDLIPPLSYGREGFTTQPCYHTEE